MSLTRFQMKQANPVIISDSILSTVKRNEWTLTFSIASYWYGHWARQNIHTSRKIKQLLRHITAHDRNNKEIFDLLSRSRDHCSINKWYGGLHYTHNWYDLSFNVRPPHDMASWRRSSSHTSHTTHTTNRVSISPGIPLDPTRYKLNKHNSQYKHFFFGLVASSTHELRLRVKWDRCTMHITQRPQKRCDEL